MKSLNLCSENLFSLIDHTIVRASVKNLPGVLSMVVELRFWRRLTLDDIAQELGISVRVVDVALKKAMRLLREECQRNPAFSRSRWREIESMQSQMTA